jgi:hypothetical protein
VGHPEVGGAAARDPIDDLESPRALAGNRIRASPVTTAYRDRYASRASTARSSVLADRAHPGQRSAQANTLDLPDSM